MPRRRLDAIGRGARSAWGKADLLPRCPPGVIQCSFRDETRSRACGAMAVTQLRLAGLEGIHAWRPYVCQPHEEHLLSPAVRAERTWEVIDRAPSYKEGFPVAG